MRRVYEIRVARAARRDISAIIKWTGREFGKEAALRYKALIDQAFEDLSIDPELPGSKSKPDVMIDNGRIYHLQFSRDHVGGSRVREPRHFVLYRIADGTVLVARVLYDQFELTRHLPEDFKHH